MELAVIVVALLTNDFPPLFTVYRTSLHLILIDERFSLNMPKNIRTSREELCTNEQNASLECRTLVCSFLGRQGLVQRIKLFQSYRILETSDIHFTVRSSTERTFSNEVFEEKICSEEWTNGNEWRKWLNEKNCSDDKQNENNRRSIGISSENTCSVRAILICWKNAEIAFEQLSPGNVLTRTFQFRLFVVEVVLVLRTLTFDWAPKRRRKLTTNGDCFCIDWPKCSNFLMTNEHQWSTSFVKRIRFGFDAIAEQSIDHCQQCLPFSHREKEYFAVLALFIYSISQWNKSSPHIYSDKNHHPQHIGISVLDEHFLLPFSSWSPNWVTNKKSFVHSIGTATLRTRLLSWNKLLVRQRERRTNSINER